MKILSVIISLFILSVNAKPLNHNLQKDQKIKTTDQIELLNTDIDAMYGPISLVKKNLNNLRTHGPTNIEDCRLSGTTVIHGPTVIKHSSLDNLEIAGILDFYDSQTKVINLTGVLSIERSKIFQELKLKGSMDATNSIITKIKADSNSIILNNCTLHEAIITGNHTEPNHAPIIKLYGSTTISGHITFVNVAGEVQIFGVNATCNQVKNGNIIKL